jgi:hypothetical protein
MKSTIPPLVCGVAIAAMSAAGISHWWSVRQFANALDSSFPSSRVPQPAPMPSSPPTAAPESANPQYPAAAAIPRDPTPAVPDPGQREFFNALVTRMENLQNQNRDLLDQLAETNRDLMKLQFRVDTHSESFRPLPVSEDRPFTSVDEGLGVLPPRAEPIMPPGPE